MRMRTESGGYRRDHFRALAQRVEVDAKEIRIMGSKSELLRTLVAASSAKTAGSGAARSPDAQAPPTVPHRVSCAASPANQIRSFTDSISTLRDGCPPGAAAEKAPMIQGSSFQWVA